MSLTFLPGASPPFSHSLPALFHFHRFSIRSFLRVPHSFTIHSLCSRNCHSFFFLSNTSGATRERYSYIHFASLDINALGFALISFSTSQFHSPIGPHGNERDFADAAEASDGVP
jgi:hypothetical protein